MALSGSTVFEIQSAATSGNVNSGGFNTANANFLTDGVVASGTGNSPTFSSASYTFVDGDNGHWIYLPAQANITSGWYSIVSQSGGVATLSAAIGAAIQITNNLYGTNTVAGVGSASPSGVTFGVDYSQSTSHRYTGTDLTGTTTACTSVSTPFTTQMVGNLIHLNSGTGVTAGWYEIVSVSVITATLDRSAGASYSLTTYHTGGALSLGSSDDAVFELAVSSATASTRYFVKGNATYTLGGTVAGSKSGNVVWPFILEGYVTTRGDRPTGSTRPTLAAGAAVFTPFTSISRVESLIITSTANPAYDSGGTGASTIIRNCKVINSSASTNRPAIKLTGAHCSAIACEAVSYRGDGIVSGAGGPFFISGCYIHDCGDSGIVNGGTADIFILNNIVAGCVTSAIDFGSAISLAAVFNNTLYGAENKLGIGLAAAVSDNNITAFNNIIYGFATGADGNHTGTANTDDYNNYFNNTSDVSSTAQWQKGSHDTALDPAFSSVQQRTGSTATTTAGNHLVQSGATFVTWGVTAGRDYVYIKSGTGVTAQVYGIASVDSETQITADVTLTANATADKVWQITTGQNFGVGISMAAIGFPGTFPAGLTTGYTDDGAAQRQGGGATLSRIITGM